MRAGAPDRDRSDRVDLVQLLHVRELGDPGALRITAGKNFAEIHLRHAVSGLTRVVILLCINKEGLEHALYFLLELSLELRHFTFADVLRDIVVRGKGRACLPDAFTNHA